MVQSKSLIEAIQPQTQMDVCIYVLNTSERAFLSTTLIATIKGGTSMPHLGFYGVYRIANNDFQYFM
ncbi:unnamed protein product [Ilex paraguariensis]|uniref:Uncharacterized protein n=1 Tax=Ilex paraguariensis TaxID=185542 RepID=A0ABC8RE50_9AQUA